MRRPRKALIAELVLWAAVAVATAVILVALSETLLPSNF